MAFRIPGITDTGRGETNAERATPASARGRKHRSLIFGLWTEQTPDVTASMMQTKDMKMYQRSVRGAETSAGRYQLSLSFGPRVASGAEVSAVSLS
jgi:hypothetical protein